MTKLLIAFFNLAVLATILFKVSKEPLKVFVAERHRGLREQLDAVRAQLKQAQAKFDEFSAKLRAVDAEVASIRQQARTEAEASKLRIANDARRMADTIVIDAKRAAEGTVQDFKRVLQNELANQVVSRAEAIIKQRMTGDDRARLRREFSQQVEAAQ